MAAEILTNLVSGVKMSSNYSKPQSVKNDLEFLQKLTDNKLSDGQVSKSVVNATESNYDPATIARFQANTPIAKSLKTIKIFNEPNKIKSAEQKDSSENDETTEESTDPIEVLKEDPIGKGYYLVTDKYNNSDKKLLPKAINDTIREKIEVAYNKTNNKKKGSLINLTF